MAFTLDANLIESFQPEDLDSIPDADIQLVCLWSYPQIESSMMLAMSLPFMYGKDNVYFVGYSPLIKQLGLHHIEEKLGFDPLQDEAFLVHAMSRYPVNYHKFKRLLLSDCDMHLRHLDAGEKVYPLFTSYGCDQGCSFCPSTTNCGRRRIEVPLSKVCTMLDQCIKQGIKSIHFTDEDFFYDINRAFKILLMLQGKGMHLIALGSAEAVSYFIAKYGVDPIKNAGLEVIEIGFESGDAEVSKKMGHGKSLSACEELAQMQDWIPFRIFWLVLTFFPGETIHSLNETGRFMLKYGFEQEEVMGRLRTNGTKIGLGQFMQWYDGIAMAKSLEKNGIKLTQRPVRLIPSYVPNSFLESIITEIHEEAIEKTIPYLELYNTALPNKPLEIGRKISYYLEDMPIYGYIRTLTALAILARGGVIR